MSQEHSIFISYRKQDGSLLANAVYYLFHGRGQTFYRSSGFTTLSLTVHIDIGIPGAVDWMEHIHRQLELAGSWIVVCSPVGATEKENEPDWLYEEIKWWITNKKHVPPILVSLKEHGHIHVPQIIQDTWPNLQVIEIETERIEQMDINNPCERTELFIQAIVQGMQVDNLQIIPGYMQLGNSSQFCSLPNFAAWEKDRFHRYVRVDEGYARAAGFDSPQSMIGKTDNQMPWRKLARHFQNGDDKLMSGKLAERLNSLEVEIMFDRIANILVNESAIVDSTGRVIGVMGCFVDVSKSQLLQTNSWSLSEHTDYNLGPEFGNQKFDRAEIYVFQSILRCKTDVQIAAEMSIDIGEAKYLINVVRTKLGCKKVADILPVAIRSGLPLELFGISDLIIYSDQKKNHGQRE